MSDSSGFSGGQILAAFIGGAVAGGAIALLTAPQSGAKTRADIRHRVVASYDEAGRVPKALQVAMGAAREAFNDSLTATASNGHDA